MKNNISTNENERSWTIQVISYINEVVKNKTWGIKSAGGELTINTGKSINFPDVILYRDKIQNSILQGWEVKMPDVSIEESSFIADAKRKAILLGLNSFILWNFKGCALYIKNKEAVFERKKIWNKTSFIVKRSDVALYRADWEDLLQQVLLELNIYLTQNIITSIDFESAITEYIIPDIIARNKTVVSEHIRFLSMRDAIINSYLEVWWSEVSQEYLQEEVNMYDAYSRMLILHWINRILFANSIRFYHDAANEVSNIIDGVTILQAEKIFEKISSKCDFYNIFYPIRFSELIPDSTWVDVIELNKFLSKKSISSIDQDALQSVLENAVRVSKREIVGQYTTPSKLAELIVKITVLNSTDLCIDPCCGTGTIPKEIIRYKLERSCSVSDAYVSTWASDKFSFPLQVTNISLTTSNSINIPCRIVRKNLFELKSGNIEHIVNPDNGINMKIVVPKFDAILSNLPFIDFNTVNREDLEYINSIAKKVFQDTKIKMTKRNDVYAYMRI